MDVDEHTNEQMLWMDGWMNGGLVNGWMGEWRMGERRIGRRGYNNSWSTSS